MSVTGTQIFTHIHNVRGCKYPLGDIKHLKDVIIIKKFRRASSKKFNVLYLLLCCRGILFRKRYPLKDLEEMEQMVVCAIPLKFKVAL